MDKEVSISLKGAGKHSYMFNVYPWHTLLLCSGVVYVVLRREKHGYSVIYVGNTGMLNNHISDHPLIAAFDKAEKTHIGIHIEPSVLMRQVKQKDLIMNFSPDLNTP